MNSSVAVYVTSWRFVAKALEAIRRAEIYGEISEELKAFREQHG